MKVSELRELLANVPDYWEVGVQAVDGDDYEVFPILGMSDERWPHTLPLIVDAPRKKFRFL